MFVSQLTNSLKNNGILPKVFDSFERNIPYRYMPDERQLLKGMQKLDPEAITEIHNQFFPPVFRYARYRLGDITLAEDISSETFVRLLDALHSGKGPKSSLRGWLMGTASNLVNDHFRKRYTYPTEPIGEMLNIEESGGNPALHFENNDRHLRIRRALQTLPQSQQHVLALRFGSGYSLIETAEIMSKKPNAIKQLQFRALTALRQELGGDFDD